jgi:hypothetical protein
MRIDSSLEEQNAFRRGAKHPLDCWFSHSPFASRGSASVAVAAVRSGIKRRWLWALFALLGVSPFILNWSTGDVAFNLLRVLSAECCSALSSSFKFASVGAIATLSNLREIEAE